MLQKFDVLPTERRKLSISQLFTKGYRRSLRLASLDIILFALICMQFVLQPTTSIHAASKHTASPNWGGYEAVAQGVRGTYREASVSFTVPYIAPITGTELSIWACVGGDISSYILVQTVIVSSWDATMGQLNGAYWEFAGTNVPNNLFGRHDMGLQIHAGDRMWVYANSNVNNNHYNSFKVKDLTTGQIATHYEYSTSVFSDGASAECIVESPTASVRSNGTNVYYPFANFGTVTLTGCVVSNGSSQMAPIGTFQNNKINVTRGSTTLATTSRLTNEAAFSVTWHHT